MTAPLRIAVTCATPQPSRRVAAALSERLALPLIGGLESRPGGGVTPLADIVHTTLAAFEYRVHQESRARAFVSDGTVIREWVSAARDRRLRATWPRAARSAVRDAGDRIFLRGYVAGFRPIVVRHSGAGYDLAVHVTSHGSTHDDVDSLILDTLRRAGMPTITIAPAQCDVAVAAALTMLNHTPVTADRTPLAAP